MSNQLTSNQRANNKQSMTKSTACRLTIGLWEIGGNRCEPLGEAWDRYKWVHIVTANRDGAIELFFRFLMTASTRWREFDNWQFAVRRKRFTWTLFFSLKKVARLWEFLKLSGAVTRKVSLTLKAILTFYLDSSFREKKKTIQFMIEIFIGLGKRISLRNTRCQVTKHIITSIATVYSSIFSSFFPRSDQSLKGRLRCFSLLVFESLALLLVLLRQLVFFF